MLNSRQKNAPTSIARIATGPPRAAADAPVRRLRSPAPSLGLGGDGDDASAAATGGVSGEAAGADDGADAAAAAVASEAADAAGGTKAWSMARTSATYWAWAAAGLRLCADPGGPREHTHGTRHTVAGNDMYT